jgi:ElaB/YqjD/DUF883 family membrane-anchored ribosome-binding protein
MDLTTPTNRTDVTNGGGTAAGTAARVDEYASRAHRTIDRAATSAQPAVDKLATNAHEVVDRVSDTVSGAAQGLDSRIDDLQSTQERLADQCRSYVEDNPLKAVGIALAAGFILAKIL